MRENLALSKIVIKEVVVGAIEWMKRNSQEGGVTGLMHHNTF